MILKVLYFCLVLTRLAGAGKFITKTEGKFFPKSSGLVITIAISTCLTLIHNSVFYIAEVATKMERNETKAGSEDYTRVLSSKGKCKVESNLNLN